MEKEKPKKAGVLRMLVVWCRWRLELAKRRRTYQEVLELVRTSRSEGSFKGMHMLELTIRVSEAKVRLTEWEALW